MISYNMTQPQLREMNPDTAVLPFGSLEQHGYHLPLSTDCITAEAFANRISKEMNAFQIPTIPISNCREHMGKMGSVWMNPDTFYNMVLDICNSLKEQGFKKVVIIQGHGGIFVLAPAIRQLNATLNPDLMVCVVNYYDFLEEFREQGIIESDVCLHADELETSVVMHLRPDLVKADKIVDHKPSVSRPYLSYGSIFCACPDGVWGVPSLASAEKGEKILEMGTKLMVEAANKAFDYMQNKKPVGYSKF